MTKPVLNYNGYSGSAETSFDDDCLFGKILFIDDLITYEGNTPGELKQAFICAVDRYLEYCKQTGKPANKTYSGSFNIRTGPELHKKAAIAACTHGMTLNEYVINAIQICVDHNGLAKVEHTHKHLVTIEPIQQSETHMATMERPSTWETVNASRH